MKTLSKWFLLIGITGLFFSCNNSGNSQSENEENTGKEVSSADSTTWKLGTQAYTFRNFTFFEAIDKTHDLGLHYIEAYPGQEISKEINGKVGFDLDQETKEKILDYLESKDMKWVAFGVIVPKTHEEWDSLFAFAKEMGIENIVSEPRPEDLAFVDSLCQEYAIHVAIHNHPKPSPYWHPDSLLTHIDGLSAYIGSCFDVGHFVRSGLDPVEALKKLKGRVIESHFKDVSDNSPEAEDTIWGTGVCNLPAVAKELKAQNFDGVLSIEYEADPEDNMEQIRKSISFFNKELN